MFTEKNVLAHWHLEYLQSKGSLGDPSLGNMPWDFWRELEIPGYEGRMVAGSSTETW